MPNDIELSSAGQARLLLLLEIRSLTALRYKLDDEAQAPAHQRFFSDELLAKLNEAVQTNQLDAIYLVMHEALGNTEKAQELREWLKGSEQRRKESRDPQRLRELGLLD